MIRIDIKHFNIFEKSFDNRSFIKFLINRDYIKKVTSNFLFGEKQEYFTDTIPSEECDYCRIGDDGKRRLCFKHSVIEDLNNPEKITEITNLISFDFTTNEKNKIGNVFNRFFIDFSKFLKSEYDTEEIEDIFEFMINYNIMDFNIKSYIINRNLVIDIGKEDDVIVFVSNPDLLRKNFTNNLKFVEKLSVFVVKKPQIIRSSKSIDYKTIEMMNKSFSFDFSETEIFIAEKLNNYSWDYRVEEKEKIHE